MELPWHTGAISILQCKFPFQVLQVNTSERNEAEKVHLHNPAPNQTTHNPTQFDVPIARKRRVYKYNVI